MEAFNRDTKLTLKAKEVFGYDCFIDRCKNTFLTPKGKPYIEVHHIVPLFQKGEDCLGNLSLLCAHHHKMAHFAEKDRAKELQARLLEINHKRMRYQINKVYLQGSFSPLYQSVDNFINCSKYSPLNA